MTPTPPVSRREINRRYVPPPSHEPHVAPKRHGLRRPAPVGGQRRGRSSDAVRVALLPLLLVYALLVLIGLELRLARKRNPGGLHGEALGHVDEFVAQYPLHLYPTLAKSLELAHLLRELPKHADAPRIVELAIGDGTLSRHVFPSGTNVVGADLAPQSLRFAAQMQHVRFAVVCDCLDPPFAAGAFDLLVSNNFLHHVSSKRETLSRWARIARVIMFSENTRYWATSWPTPFILRRLGLRNAAERVTAEIEESHFQDLLPLTDLDELTAADSNVVSRDTCFSERTFFIAATFSTLMRCTGPPTPSVVKALLLGPLRALSLPLTRRIARDLICYDALADRSRDVYVLYVLESRAWQRSDDELICPQCGASLNGVVCSSCGTRFPEADGMVFVLPDALAHIERDYDAIAGAAQSAEQL